MLSLRRGANTLARSLRTPIRSRIASARLLRLPRCSPRPRRNSRSVTSASFDSCVAFVNLRREDPTPRKHPSTAIYMVHPRSAAVETLLVDRRGDEIPVEFNACRGSPVIAKAQGLLDDSGRFYIAFATLGEFSEC